MSLSDKTAKILFDKKEDELNEGTSRKELEIDCEKSFADLIAENDNYLDKLIRVAKEKFFGEQSNKSELLKAYEIDTSSEILAKELTATFGINSKTESDLDDSDLTLDSNETENSVIPKANVKVEDLKPGDEIGVCTIIEFIGKGGSGIVYKAKHKTLGIEVAIKFLTAEVRKNPTVVQRFMKEARAMARMRHQNILRVYDCDSYGSDNCYIVMDYVKGSDLKDSLEMRKGIDLEISYEHMKQISSAMAQVHKEGIVHRDIKPANILINDKGEAILMDFGIAKDYQTEEIQVTLETQTMGTPHYMSPEQIESTSKVTSAADIYSLGVTFYEMLGGKKPIGGKTLTEVLNNHKFEVPAEVKSLNNNVPEKVSLLIDKMLSKKASERPKDGSELVEELKQTLGVSESVQENVSEAKAAEDLKEGDVIGPCTIINFLGKGGSGIVYKAKHKTLGIEVAIKFLTAEVRKSPTVVQRFMKEARAMARMRHQNILRVYDCDSYGIDNCYIVMDYVKGSDLKDFLDIRKEIDLDLTLSHMTQISSAMAEVHREGIVHRDIKPANVLINDKGEAILMDFGIAKDYQSEEIQVTLETQTMGTPHYMSPEQIESTSKVTSAADIYSLGVTFYEMLSGSKPINGKTLREVLVKHATLVPERVTKYNMNVPKSISKLIEKMLSKDAVDRPQNGAELVDELKKAISEIGETAEPKSIDNSKKEVKDDPKKFPVALIFAALTVLVVLIVVFLPKKNAPDENVENPNDVELASKVDSVPAEEDVKPVKQEVDEPEETSKPEIGKKTVVEQKPIVVEKPLDKEIPLEHKVVKIFERKCTECHVSITTLASSGNRKKGSAHWRGVHFMSELIHRQIDPKIKDYKKQDLYFTLKEDMPPTNAKQGKLSSEEWIIIEKWLASGAVISPNVKDLISQDVVYSAILKDLSAEGEKKSFRYFTLSNLYNSTSNSSDMDLYRLALVKLINSITTSSTLIIPKVVNGTKETVFRVDLDELRWDVDTWNELMTFYPHELAQTDNSLKKIKEVSKVNSPIVRADWFVMIASQNPFYSKFLSQPKTLRDLEIKLGLNRMKNIQDNKAIRSGTVNSGVSSQNRLIERHKADHGYVWFSYDFSSKEGAEDILEFPLGPQTLFPSNRSFKHKSEEVIYSLPNGLLGYFMANDLGSSLSKGDEEIVLDKSNKHNGLVINGISCIACHDRGIKKSQDEVQVFVKRNSERFTPAERMTVSKLYPEKSALYEVFREDRQEFRQSIEKMVSSLFNDEQRIKSILSRIGYTPGSVDVVEPVKQLFERYMRKVDLEYAAAGFDLDPLKFEQLAQSKNLIQLVSDLKKEGVSRYKFNSLLMDISSKTAIKLQKAQAIDLPIFSTLPKTDSVIRLSGIENLIQTLKKSTFIKYKNVALGRFETTDLSEVNVFIRKSLARAISNDDELNLVNEREIVSVPEAMDYVLGEASEELVNKGIDYVLGGQIIEEASKIKLFLKIADLREKTLHKLNYEISIEDSKGKDLDLGNKFVASNPELSRKNISEIDELSKLMLNDFQVSLSCNGEGAAFFEGENMIFNVNSQVDAYIVLLAHQIDGSTVQLFPNEFASDNLVKAGVNFTFPSNSKYDIEVSEPFGRDVLQVIAFTDKKELELYIKETDPQTISGIPYKILNREKLKNINKLNIKSKAAHVELKVLTLPRKKRTRGL